MHIPLTHDDVVAITPHWSGERGPDGRPHVADDVLERLATATIEQAWSTAQKNGYPRQFAGGWQETHPGTVIVGRAVTAGFLPHRPDLDDAVVAAGARSGNTSADHQNSWVVDALGPGDVMVVDIFGKIAEGTVIGDNLGTAVAARTGVGAVINGGIRDLQGLQELEGVNFFYRGTDPTPIRGVTLASMNAPVRLGEATVLPGDVILGTPAGVFVIPAHLAETVALQAEDIAARDVFGKLRLSQRRYSGADIDVSPWAEEIEADYRSWSQADARETGVDTEVVR